MLTHKIDLRNWMEREADWMEREADRQREQHGEKLHKMIEDASKALDHFTEDELEEATRR